MIRKLLWLGLFIASSVAVAQNPQTQTAPLYATNAKYTNGVAPGYMPCANDAANCSSTSGLNLSVGPGTANCSGTIETYAGGTLTMTASATNYVYLNTAASCAPAVKTSAFAAGDIPIATVVAGGSSITSIVDDRTPFSTPGSTSSGITQLTGDVTTATGGGSQAATLATVNGSPGACGDSTHVCAVTTNGKGLVTAQSAVAISASGGGALPGIPTYTFYVSSGTVYARNEATGTVAYSGTDAAVVINDVLAATVNTGANLYFKQGTYNFNSATAETVSPYTGLSYAVGIPATQAVVYPQFRFLGETAGIGSQVNPATTGVIFNVTTDAETAAGSNVLAAFWMRPSTVTDTDYPLGSIYWNDHLEFQNIIVNFPANTRGNEIAIDALEASFLKLDHVQAGFVTAPSALGASGDVAFVTPGTYSDGAYIEQTQVQPGFWQGYQVNTEHSVLINTEAFRATTCYTYGYAQSRNGASISHSGQWIHPQVYDCVNGITVGGSVNTGAQLDIIGLDFEYTTDGTWAYSSVFNAGSGLGGLLTWSNIKTGVGPGSLTNPFSSGGGNYTVELNGQFLPNRTTLTVSAGSVAASCSGITYNSLTATGLQTGMGVNITPISDVTSVSGWGNGDVYFAAYPSAANTLSWKVCTVNSSGETLGANTTWNVTFGK